MPKVLNNISIQGETDLILKYAQEIIILVGHFMS